MAKKYQGRVQKDGMNAGAKSDKWAESYRGDQAIDLSTP